MSLEVVIERGFEAGGYGGGCGIRVLESRLHALLLDLETSDSHASGHGESFSMVGRKNLPR